MGLFEVNEEGTLPSKRLCAIMAYENLKYGGNADSALAWATLGNLVGSLDGGEDYPLAAVEVAKAAHAVAVEDTDQNRKTLQKALAKWISLA